MFANQKTVTWWGNFAFLLATKYRIQMPKWGFDGTFSQKDGGRGGSINF